MATNNQINNPLVGDSGTGTQVLNTSPTLISPALGAATGTSLTFSSTSGIIGTTTNDTADAGSVGQVISSSVLVGSKVSLTTNTYKDVTSISLTAGDWIINGSVAFECAAGTTASYQEMWISTTSVTAAVKGAENNGAVTLNTMGNSESISLNNGDMRLSLSGTTTVYLVAYCTFISSTMAAYGLIQARRAR